MSNAKHVTDNLSAYLDNRLRPKERARFEAHLRTCAQCRQDLRSLQYSIGLLKQMPVMRAPRSFALSDEQAAQALPRWQGAWLRQALQGVTALATILFLLVISADILLLSPPGGPSPAAAPVPAVGLALTAAPGQPDRAPATEQQSKGAATTAAAAVPTLAAPANTAPRVIPSPAASPTARHTQSPESMGVLETTATASSTATRTATPSATATASPSATATRPPTPTHTATPVPTATPAREALVTQSPLRAIEIGLLGVIVFGVVALLVLRVGSR